MWSLRAFAALAAVSFAALASSSGAACAQTAGWTNWNASAITTKRGYPVFTADGRPFFIYGAAFFYERIPRDRWQDALQAYRRMGINTIDLYVIWNWHEPVEGAPDFTGATDPRRDLAGLLKLTHGMGFKIVLRPGPVIRNEWRNGGYPDWLLERPEYAMPLHDVLEGRYPATATLQNAHADAAGAEWLANGTHLEYSAKWLHDVLAAVAPYAGDVIAIALDDDQGAYIDNDTWPAPHWHAYVDWLRLTVAQDAGPRVPLFINTFSTKVPAASPAWAWGDWYQSDAYSVGEHDLANIDFATGLLQTQPHQPVMQAEFQAGWLQGADEGVPRPADPANTALALHELLRDGAHGIVNFPVQDTIYPDGWEAPWANWSYAWDAALTTTLGASPRYAPTAAFGEELLGYGEALARTHVAADAAIVWPPSMFSSSMLTNADFAAFADATTAMQRQCASRGLACDLVDLAYADDEVLDRYPSLVMPVSIAPRLLAAMGPPQRARYDDLLRRHRLTRGLAAASAHPYLPGGRDATLLLADDDSYGFIVAINPSKHPRTLGPFAVAFGKRHANIAAVTMPARSTRLIAFGDVRAAGGATVAPLDTISTPPPFADPNGQALDGSRLHAVFAPQAGARIAQLSAAGLDNAASSIGLLRDAVDPMPSPSARDYIAPYTHPLPAGTFNRTYACTSAERDMLPRVKCSYDAPDLPASGALFERTLSLPPDAGEIDVDERFTPHDAASTASLESISGFAFAEGDVLVAPDGANFAGVLHGHRLAALRWRPGDVARVAITRNRGAAIVTLVFSKRRIRLALGIYAASGPGEAEALLRAKPGPRP